MPNAYWNAHAPEVDEEPDYDEIEALDRVWGTVFDRIFPLSPEERALLNWESE